MDEYLATVHDAILDGDVMGTTDGVQAALQPERIRNDGMIFEAYDLPPEARATTSSRDKACPVV
jgi:hypothetical protein